MDIQQYGFLANTVAIAGFLVATFGVLVVKIFGRFKKWTWMVERTPPFLVTASGRIVCVALMGITYLFITEENYLNFAYLAGFASFVCFILIAIFDSQRRKYTIEIEITGENGLKSGSITKVIGTEDDMDMQAKKDFKRQKKQGGISLKSWLSGYGTDSLYDTNAVWSNITLAKYSNRLTLLLMGILLSAVIALFWVAFAIDFSMSLQN
ncbi:MAG: hypothetical protein JJ971_10440 [Balneolaceae bacterium]|nr:hypothetical protein [Balneolaceae bacterium]MBO6546337.1 hypothetical protein [Balneolaceae bacterium]MBO6648696.1 hypothetical protein [Balneolaceae bacterium]